MTDNPNGLPRGYDAWRLASPCDESDGVGEEDGQPCNRWIEPDEDYPKPRKCTGTMTLDVWRDVMCDMCGEMP